MVYESNEITIVSLVNTTEVRCRFPFKKKKKKKVRCRYISIIIGPSGPLHIPVNIVLTSNLVEFVNLFI